MDRVREILRSNGFPEEILNNPFFLPFVIYKFNNGYVILRDSEGTIVLQKLDDLYRNSGLRIMHETRFLISEIYDLNKNRISGVNVEEITEVRSGDFRKLDLAKWSYKVHLNLKTSFYDTEGVLMQREYLHYNNVIRKQNGYEGIEAYNSPMNPYLGITKRTIERNGLILPRTEEDFKQSVTVLIQRSFNNPDKLLYEEMRGNVQVKKLYTNNGSNLFDLDVPHINEIMHDNYIDRTKDEMLAKLPDYNDKWSENLKTIYFNLKRRIENI